MSDGGRLVGPATPLESWWVPVGVLAGTALVVCLLMALRRRGRPRRRWPIVAVAMVGLLAGALLGANSYAGYLPTPGAVPAMAGFPDAVTARGDGGLPPGHGSLVASVRLGSPALSVPTERVYVYLPPGYRGGTARYPVLYLFGGWPGRNTDWLVAGRLPAVLDALIDAGRVQPMIVVMPDTTLGGFHDTECLDAVSGPQLETYLSRTLPRYVDRHFRTLADRAGRAVAGMSSGGYCALNLGLHHTGHYSAIAALEPYPSPGSGPERNALAGRRRAIRRNTITDYLPTMRFAGPMQVLLDRPAHASPRERSDDRRLAALLRSRGQPVTTRTEPTRHTWRLAQRAEPTMLEFISRHLTAAGPHRSGAPR